MTEKGTKDQETVRWSIRWKLMGIITLLVFALVAVLSYTQISSQRKILEMELNERIALMRANLIERGKGFIINLSQQIENDLAVLNLSGVMRALKESAESNREIKYAILMNSSGVALMDTHRPDLTQTRLTGARDREALNQSKVTVMTYREGDESIVEIVNPLQISTEPWGVLRLIYTLKLLENEIEISRKEIRQEIRRMIYRSIMTSLLFLGGCLLLVFFLSTRFSKPLIRLTESARKLSKGDFTISSDIQIRSKDEIGVLGASFVEMSKDLEGSYKKLEEYSNRYRALFEYSPTSLWEEDFSEVKTHIDGLRDKGIRDFRAYFNDHPEELKDCTGMIKILDVNESTLKLYEADNKDELAQSLDKILTDESHEIFKEQVLAIAEGKAFEIQCVNRTLTGRKITVLMKASIPPGYEKNWAKVLISVHDLSERMRAVFLKDMFCRYLSEEVTNTLLENPDLVNLGGEKRSGTIMISDLRGFTSLAERLEPEQVVQILNTYFEIMVEVLLKYNATINEIIGDALLVIFGAPQKMPDRARRAIACAIEMQNAMVKVNEENRMQGLPEIEMGIGLNEDEVIVGNIGSSRRSKYGVVGSGVNMTSRIESYTVGGQILISDSVRKQAGEILRIDEQREVIPKGSEAPLKIYEVGGIGVPYNLALEEKEPSLVVLGRRVPLLYTLLDAKDVGKDQLKGLISRLSKKGAEVELKEPLKLLTNIKMNLGEVSEELASKDFYGKVIEYTSEDQNRYIVRFTSASPEVSAYFQALRQYGVREMSTENA
ncbi:MAG TPA: adenylate/guanylate cyclase domain-containing protein [Deltaproteobacteria bacterium]|nr:adenylate/guanylate cyclase domain-containing protein [Deltaproteobacteria bacterium]